MTESANVYGQLLLSSFLIGIFLHVTSDLLAIIRALIFHSSNNKSNIFHKNHKSSIKRPLTPLDPKRSFRKSFDTLYPRNESLPERIVTVVSDILFAIIASISVILLLFAVNNGIMRGFVIPICICGAILYRYTLSKLFSVSLYTVISFITRIVSKLLRTLLQPLTAISSRLFGIARHRAKCVLRWIISRKKTKKLIRKRKSQSNTTLNNTN